MRWYYPSIVAVDDDLSAGSPALHHLRKVYKTSVRDKGMEVLTNKTATARYSTRKKKQVLENLWEDRLANQSTVDRSITFTHHPISQSQSPHQHIDQSQSPRTHCRVNKISQRTS